MLGLRRMEGSHVAVDQREGSDGLGYLLEALELRVRRRGQPPYVGAQELGCFVEEVHAALCKSLGTDPDRTDLGQWHKVLKDNAGIVVHPAWYEQLRVVYGWRNIASHPTEQRNEITSDHVLRDLSLVQERVRDLAHRLHARSFVEELFAVQRTCEEQRLGQRLLVALDSSGPPENLAGPVMEYALGPLRRERARLEAVPVRWRTRAVVRSLARLADVGPQGHLVRLAEYLCSNLPDEIDREPLRQWIQAEGLAAEPDGVGRRLDVLRVAIEADPEHAGRYRLTAAWLIEPRIPDVERFLPPLPIEMPGLEALPHALKAVLNGLHRALAASRPRDAMHWSDFVLQLQVPPELALAGLDELKHRLGPLWTLFRCVTVRPIVGRFLQSTLRGDIAHPDLGGNSRAIEEPMAPEEIFLRMRGRDCLFAGPSLGVSEPNTVPAVVSAFDGYSCTVIEHTESLSDALQRLFSERPQCDLGTLLDRVTERREAGQRLTILWDDDDYDHLNPESV